MHTFSPQTFKDYETALKRLREQRIAAEKNVERCRTNLAEAEEGLATVDASISDGEQIVAYMTFVNLQAGAADTAETAAEVAF